MSILSTVLRTINRDLEPAFCGMFPSDGAPDAGACDGIDDPDAPLPFADAKQAQSPVFALGTRIADTAQRFFYSDELKDSLAHGSRYHSVNPEITGDYKDHPKCNLFAGDVLHAAGFQVPTYDMKGGGKHYKQAEQWPKETAFFDKVTSLDDVRPGDILIIDYRNLPGSGGGAHVEVITGKEGEGDDMHVTTAGARHDGLVEDEKKGNFLVNARREGDHFFIDGKGRLGPKDIYVLRPKRQEG